MENTNCSEKYYFNSALKCGKFLTDLEFMPIQKLIILVNFDGNALEKHCCILTVFI